ncbi:unnamed protein product [Ectocarpus sp. 12 AP-2014]
MRYSIVWTQNQTGLKSAFDALPAGCGQRFSHHLTVQGNHEDTGPICRNMCMFYVMSYYFPGNPVDHSKGYAPGILRVAVQHQSPHHVVTRPCRALFWQR